MRIVHGLITLVAAIVVIAFAGSWLSEKYGVGEGFGIFDGVKSDNNSDAAVYPYKKVPANGPDKLSVPVRELFGGPGWIFNTSDGAPAPVILARPQLWDLSFRGHSQYGNASLRHGGDCRTPTVNLIVPEADAGAGAPLFDHRVFIPSYVYHEEEGTRRVYALVVDEDSNEDGFYTCWDDARLEFVSLNDGSRTVLDRVFTPGDISEIDFDLQERQLVFVERKEAAERIQQSVLKISFEGEIISEEMSPDLLSEAKAAFERTGSD